MTSIWLITARKLHQWDAPRRWKEMEQNIIQGCLLWSHQGNLHGNYSWKSSFLRASSGIWELFACWRRARSQKTSPKLWLAFWAHSYLSIALSRLPLVSTTLRMLMRQSQTLQVRGTPSTICKHGFLVDILLDGRYMLNFILDIIKWRKETRRQIWKTHGWIFASEEAGFFFKAYGVWGAPQELGFLIWNLRNPRTNYFKIWIWEIHFI